MYGYKVDIKSTLTFEKRSDERFGSWEEAYTNRFKGILRDDKYPDACTSSEIESSNEPFYLVWVEYSTGDSFGRSERGRVEVIDIFEKGEDADKVAAAIEEHDKLRSKFNARWGDERREIPNEIKVEISGGTYALPDIPWSGYFESFDAVNIETISKFSIKRK
jgi:hypothetical protein